MKILLDKDIRCIISKCLRDHKKIFKKDNSCDFHMSLKELDETLIYILETRKHSKNIIGTELRSEISISYLGIVSNGALSMAINQDDLAGNPLPKDYISEDNINPKIVIQALLVQITNYSLSVITLIEQGLDNSARIILRSIFELVAIVLIISWDKDEMIKYIQGMDEEEAKRTWYQHFRIDNLNKKLNALESILGLPKSFSQEMNGIRSGSYEFYSSLSHGACFSSVIVAYSFPFDEEKDINLGLFGLYSSASRRTISYLNEILYYLSLMQIIVFNKIHGFKAPSNNELWRMAISLRNCLTKSYLFIRERKENEENIENDM